MNELTKQDIALLMEAIERWETPDIPCVLGILNGPRCDVERKMQEAWSLRKERSVILRAKLIQMRDSVVAGEFMDSAKPAS
jgi:hypothetical protein